MSDIAVGSLDSLARDVVPIENIAGHVQELTQSLSSVMHANPIPNLPTTAHTKP
jgi:hypothetical protein